MSWFKTFLFQISTQRLDFFKDCSRSQRNHVSEPGVEKAQMLGENLELIWNENILGLLFYFLYIANLEPSSILPVRCG